ncbi:MAG: M23 family metallopeptidase [Bacteroidales bacterium]|nr:M23 family metallopeptidase [Bacteroidales bacterium]
MPETAFRFPCSDELGHGYYIAQGFQDSIHGDGAHLGLDINGLGGGNSDLGDTIYSIGDGIVANTYDTDYLSIYYKYKGKVVKALYYHCKDIFPKAGDFVSKGEAIATIGNSDGMYLAHLHFELMKDTSIDAGFYGFPEGKFYDPIDVLPFYNK